MEAQCFNLHAIRAEKKVCSVRLGQGEKEMLHLGPESPH